MPAKRPMARPAKPLAPAIARPNVIVNKPNPVTRPIRTGQFMPAPGAAWSNPAPKPPGATISPWVRPAVPPPTPTRTPLGYDQRNGESIFPTIPTVPGPAAPEPGWGPSGGALGQFLKLLGLIK